MLKSVVVVLLSYVLCTVLVFATDPLLSRVFPNDFVAGRVPSTGALVASTSLFVVISFVCAWVCAYFAPNRPGRHVFWFFVIGELLGMATTIPNWSKPWPHWYWLSWLLSWPLSCYLGLMLSRRRRGREVSASLA